MLPRSLLVLLLLAGFLLPTCGGTLVQFRTTFGTVEVLLYDAEKPATSDNFKRLVKSGAYQNTFLHRLVPGFVAQGGSYTAFNRTSTNLFAPAWVERGFVPSFGPITNEYGVGPTFSNTNGTLAMAKVAGNPNSATTGWFFNLANNSTNLDSQNGGFTVFGRVIRDTNNVLGFLNSRSYGNGLVDMRWWYSTNTEAADLYATLPVNYPGFFHPTYANLLFVDISLLEVAVGQTNGFPLVSWTAVAGKTNTLEFTTNMPPQWQTLDAFVPTPGRVGFIDNAGDPKRFYRVRVDY